MENERFITSTLNKKDVEAETTLRPQTFGSFPGQTKTKDRLEIYVAAAKTAPNRSVTCSSADRRDSAKRRSPTSSPTKKARTSRPQAVPSSKNRAISPDCSPRWKKAIFCSSTKSTV